MIEEHVGHLGDSTQHEELQRLRTDIAQLRAESAELRSENAELRAENAELRAERDDVRAQLAAVLDKLQEYEQEVLQLRKRVTGRTTEKRKRTGTRPASNRPKNDEQAQQARNANKQARNKLPTVPVPHAVPDAELEACSNCGHDELERVGDDVSYEYEYVPGHLEQREHRCETWRCTECNHFTRAQPPVRVYDRCHYGPRFIAKLIVEKCSDSIPLNRQAKAWNRQGVPMARSTLVDLFHRSAELLLPLYFALLALVAKADVVYADETSLKMQRVKKLGFIWTFACETAITYVYSADRSGNTPVEILGDSSGKLVVDGYTGYNEVCTPSRRTRCGCNAHSRRKFHEADGEYAREVLDQFAIVFDVEKKAKENGIYRTPDHLTLRQSRAGPAMDAMKAWCEGEQGRHGPKTPLGKAIKYFLNQWEPLTAFLRDVNVEPSNNLSERLLRIIALGRKNWLFVGHEAAGQNTAALCSLVVSCELHGINPEEYLADVLIRIQTHPASLLHELLPHNWRKLVEREQSLG